MNPNCIPQIIEKFDTPIYLLDFHELTKNILEFRSAFERFGTAFAIAYPFKTNPTIEIVSYFLNQGCWAEVSSEKELLSAINLKLAPGKIIYNSPYKRTDSLLKAIEFGCKIHVDNFEELERVIHISKSFQSGLKIGIRISKKSSKWEKFGFRIGRETDDILGLLLNEKQITINSFHIHESNIADLHYYRQHIREIFNFADKAQYSPNVNLEYIDVGSGFTIDFPVPKDKNNWHAPSLNEYAEIIEQERSKTNISQDTIIIIEPGRRLVASSMSLLTKVISIKERGNKKLAILDLGQNLIPGVDFYRYPITKIEPNNERSFEVYELHGSLCDSMDIIATEISLPTLRSGNHLLIGNVGGYDIARSFSWQIEIPKIIVVKDNYISRVIEFKNH